MIRQTLAANNKQSVRLQGFELLLYFMKGLRTPSNDQIDEQINWFASALNLKPFVSSEQTERGYNTKLKVFPQEGKPFDIIFISRSILYLFISISYQFLCYLYVLFYSILS